MSKAIDSYPRVMLRDHYAQNDRLSCYFRIFDG